jgi:hypothetical protein
MKRPLRFKETERGPSIDLCDKGRDQGIRCPVCAWRPRADSRWSCRCHHTWNTFDTRGRCPACNYQWLETQCLSCHVMSPHEAWYAPIDPPA